ncbi:hypothetical protein PVAP13_3KG435202 [Panicum virgatum]|uniref:Uncharacterized protein n=1 Tax=Panicum virgatum TaxID=38727 RepID=A0A8T0V499_PANVG|nr:hypothetical protein PVAP13_3KG435202 [Panicum virgatum]
MRESVPPPRRRAPLQPRSGSRGPPCRCRGGKCRLRRDLGAGAPRGGRGEGGRGPPRSHARGWRITAPWEGEGGGGPLRAPAVGRRAAAPYRGRGEGGGGPPLPGHTPRGGWVAAREGGRGEGGGPTRPIGLPRIKFL